MMYIVSRTLFLILSIDDYKDDSDDYIWQPWLGGIGLVIDGRVDPPTCCFRKRFSRLS